MSSSRAHLAVDGSVDASTSSGHRATLRGHGDVLTLDVSSVGGARDLLAARPSRGTLASCAAALASAGLTAHLQIAGARVASLGRDVEPSWTSRLLGLRHVALRPASFLRAAARGRDR